MDASHYSSRNILPKKLKSQEYLRNFQNNMGILRIASNLKGVSDNCSKKYSTLSDNSTLKWFSNIRLSKEGVENGIAERKTEPTETPCTEIIIVRHGETEWNALGKMQGQMDIELNEVGRQQAVIVAERLSKEPYIRAIYSSDLKRALYTAETIASKCGGLENSGRVCQCLNSFLSVNLEGRKNMVVIEKDLRERHVGDLQGLVYYESAKVNPKAFEALNFDQEIPGGGESYTKLYKRCTSSLQRIAEKHRGARVIVVTHGAVIQALYKRAMPGGCAGGVYNTSISIIQLFKGDVWSIKLWNDTGHLKETEFLESASGGGDSS